MPDSVFSAGGGRSSVDAWYTSSLDIEEVLSGAAYSHVHLFVADVVKSFDTVDRATLDCVLSPLAGFTFLITVRFVPGLSWLLVLVSPGLVMEVFLRVVL